MTLRTKLGIAIVIALLALGILVVAYTSGPVDRCLDLGGRWNHELDVCESG